MAATQVYFALVIVAVAYLVVGATATDYVVGDDQGWTINVDYEKWAEGKDFKVGDKLIFKYTKGEHNVITVEESAYKSCTVPKSGALTSGNDVITLSSTGDKYYICGVGRHCMLGQKLEIEVKESSNSSAKGIASSGFLVFALGLVTGLLLILEA